MSMIILQAAGTKTKPVGRNTGNWLKATKMSGAKSAVDCAKKQVRNRRKARI